MPKHEQHAPPDALLGQLQRGRGEGYLRILKVPRREAWALLIDCICNDPRLDSQVESRAGYYASVGIEVGLGLAPLATYLREHDDQGDSTWNTPLTVGTLGEFAKRGYGNAADLLIDYMEWGQWWDWPVDDLTATQDPSLHRRVAQAVERRFPSDEKLEKALAWCFLDSQPWTTLIQHSARIGRFQDNLRKQEGIRRARGPVVTNAGALSLNDLLERADQSNHLQVQKAVEAAVEPKDVDILMQHISFHQPYVAKVALAGLAKLAPPDIVDQLVHLWSANPKMPGFLRSAMGRVMAKLPAAQTLPIARDRLYHQESHERFLAEHLFAARAVPEDIPLLRAAIQRALSDDDANCYRLCNLVEAFSKLPKIGPIPELAAVFIQFRYSYGRVRAAEALRATAADEFGHSFALECLWDCEEGTRVVGVGSVPLETDDALGRLRWLAEEPLEDNEVKAAARKRLPRKARETHSHARRQ